MPASVCSPHYICVHVWMDVATDGPALIGRCTLCVVVAFVFGVLKNQPSMGWDVCMPTASVA